MEFTNNPKLDRPRQRGIGRWIKFGIVTLLYLLFLLWVKSWWGLIVVPFIFDIYITKFIPWGFWKKSNNPAVRSVMSWVDAIVFALVAVYFVNIYLFQNYQIPSSSLEKSLLVGDFLYVSKVSYGPRVPNTPYKRVKGFGRVKLHDIVVFNFPAGDTVALNHQMEDFYSLAYREGRRLYPNPVEMDSLTREQQRAIYDLYYAAGRKLILTNPQLYGDIVVRPVDRRENYVKRCTGLPGDTLQIIDGRVYLNGQPTPVPENVQFNYFVQTTGPVLTQDRPRPHAGYVPRTGHQQGRPMAAAGRRRKPCRAGFAGPGRPGCAGTPGSRLPPAADAEDV